MQSQNTLRVVPIHSVPGVVFNPSPWRGIFNALYPGEMRILAETGVWGGHTVSNPYSPEEAPVDFSNIGEHSIAVASAARILARALIESGKLPNRSFRRVVQRALLHDASKPYELFYWRSGGAAGDVMRPREDFIRLLQGCRMPSSLVQIALTAGTETGHASVASFLTVDDSGFHLTPGRLPEKIVHLCDSITQSSVPPAGQPTRTEFVEPAERMHECLKRYPFIGEAGLGVDANGRISELPDVLCPPNGVKSIGTFAELQTFVAESICVEIQQALVSNVVCTREESCEFVLRVIRMGMREPT